jgi:hypothetical protein
VSRPVFYIHGEVPPDALPVTYVVCGQLGLDSSGETIPHGAAWGEAGALDAIQQDADTIGEVARRIETRIAGARAADGGGATHEPRCSDAVICAHRWPHRNDLHATQCTKVRAHANARAVVAFSRACAASLVKRGQRTDALDRKARTPPSRLPPPSRPPSTGDNDTGKGEAPGRWLVQRVSQARAERPGRGRRAPRPPQGQPTRSFRAAHALRTKPELRRRIRARRRRAEESEPVARARDDEVSRAVRDAHESAVEANLDCMARDAAVDRRGQGGANSVLDGLDRTAVGILDRSPGLDYVAILGLHAAVLVMAFARLISRPRKYRIHGPCLRRRARSASSECARPTLTPGTDPVWGLGFAPTDAGNRSQSGPDPQSAPFARVAAHCNPPVPPAGCVS